MTTRTVLAAIALCVFISGCGNSAEKQTAEAKAAAERKAVEERATAETQTAEAKAVAERKAVEERAAADKKAADSAAQGVYELPTTPTKVKDPPTIQDDLKALAGDKETTWELSKKDAKGNTIRLTFYRDKDATAKFGRLWVLSDQPVSAAVAGFEFKVEEKDKRRFLTATESAFQGEGADARLPYVLQGDTLKIEGGKASNQVLGVGVIDLKGEWKRAKTELKLEPESKEPEDVAKSIQKGGKFWSSPAKASRGDTSFTPGDRFWVWPVEDRVFEAKDGKLPIKFHWRVRPGQKPPQEKNDGFFAHIDFLSERGGVTGINFQGHRLDLKTGASEGIFEVTFDLKDFSGKSDILFFLSGLEIIPEKTASNLLWLKVTFPK